MNKTKIVFFEAGGDEEKAIKAEMAKNEGLKDGGPGGAVETAFIPEPLTTKNADSAKDAHIVSVFVKSQVTAAVIEKLGAAKLIVTRSTGFDHIDGAASKSRGVSVANVPAYGSRTVAEYTFALILGLSRKTLTATGVVKSTSEKPGEALKIYPQYIGFDLQGKTLGIVGTGRIGQNVAQIARGFDMNVIAFDSFPNQDAATKFGFKYVSLDELLAQSDVVSLHVPSKPDTCHLINTNNVSKIKRGAILVNTARGEVCQNEAVIKGIEEKILAGVALDVFEGEKKVAEDSAMFKKMISYPEIFITPHIAFYSKEAEHEIVSTSIGNIAAFLRGEKVNIV